MSKDNKTPQAYPYCGVGDELNYSKGMTLRDYFAAKAMQGLVAQSNESAMGSDLGIGSKWAYLMADAMLEARK